MKATRIAFGCPRSRSMARPQDQCAPMPNRYGLSAAPILKLALLCVFATTVSVQPFLAQKKSSLGVNGFGAGGHPPLTVIRTTVETGPTADDEKCFPWSISQARVTAVSVATLQIPAKAKSEYAKACDDFNKGKFADAEQHARSAIDTFSGYSAAWVLFGMILEEQHKGPEARNACSQAAAIDATYLPAYLCAAEFSVRDRDWEQVLNQSEIALGLRSEGDSYAYYYRARAYFHLNNLTEAKKSALQAEEIDVNHVEPSIYLVLAQIYATEGDHEDAITQLQQYLKHPSDRHQEDVARQFLAKLESAQSAK
jgi:tetratricopeptide (TPR) repeat protein